MTGQYIKRKAKKTWKKLCASLKKIPYEIKRFIIKKTIKNRDFSMISNNCWAGTVYRYLDMPYLSPTAGLYFFAEDFIKFVSDLHHYLNTSLEFIDATESKYFEELKNRNQTHRPIGKIDDIEIVFLHYATREEAKEKWDRRKARVNYDNIIIKFSRMNLCTEKELKAFDVLPFENKFFLNNQLPLKYKSEIFYRDDVGGERGIIRDNEPFPGKIRLKKLLDKPKCAYPESGLLYSNKSNDI